MTEKELRRLNRSELLELLLIQTTEAEQLAQKLEQTEKLLSDRNLQMEKAGDLAHAVLEINGVMEAAQAAARQYLDNIARMEQETIRRCEKMLSDAREEADRILQEANRLPKAVGAEQDLLDEIYVLLGEKTD